MSKVVPEISAAENAASVLERVLFGARNPIIALFLVITVVLGYNATQVRLDTSMQKMVPMKHEYIKNLFKHKDELGLGNDIRIAVESTDGDVFSKDYMQTLRQISDEAFYLPGIDKVKLKSLWTPNVRWVEVTEEGFRGGPVIPNTYDGSAESLSQLRENVLRSGQVGRLVADDFKSTIVHVTLLDADARDSKKLDYSAFSHQLETEIREKYQSDKIKIHIIGFAKKVGDLIDGASKVVTYFGIAILTTMLMLLVYSRCLYSTVVALTCSIIAVVWQLGLLNLLGYGIDPYSMLVPFLVFAIGVSHAVQLINSIAVECGQGHTTYESCRHTFRSLYRPGLVALVSDAIGFATLIIIDIGVIGELAKAASLGVFVVIFTNLVMVPLIMSHLRVSKASLKHASQVSASPPVIWKTISEFASPKVAPISIFIAVVALVGGLYLAKDLKIGDLDRGAPELRPDSRYNLDDNYVSDHYSVSADVLVVMVETPQEGCIKYVAMDVIDRFQWAMENVEGVQSTVSLVTVSKRMITGFNEGNLKWAALSKDQYVLNSSVGSLSGGLMNMSCSLAPVIIFLEDHKAETLDRAVLAVEKFAKINDSEHAQFVLASGNAGVEAATNQTIKASQNRMLLLVYVVVSFLCFLAFRSIRAVVCIVAPLALTSVLCEALMAQVGIGVKVATLPVIALGVGIGVDYGIYIYSRLEFFMKQGMELQEAYYETLKVTGKAVAFTGLTLAVGVGTWMFSDIKFQADMGLLLTFMFLWNMIGALWLLPALARFLIADKYKQS